jgi:hypothetical protein
MYYLTGLHSAHIHEYKYIHNHFTAFIFLSNSMADVTTSTSERCPGLDQFYWVVWGSGPGDGNGYRTEITCPVSEYLQ